MGILIEQRDALESEIERIIFIDHSRAAFELIKSKNVCKFKYSNNELLIDRLCSAFKNSIVSHDDNIYYYRKLIFDILTSEEYFKSKKYNIVVDELEQFYRGKLDKKNRDYAVCLINELKLYKILIYLNHYLL